MLSDKGTNIFSEIGKLFKEKAALCQTGIEK